MRIAVLRSLVFVGFLTIVTPLSFGAEPGEIPPPKEEPRVIDPGPQLSSQSVSSNSATSGSFWSCCKRFFGCGHSSSHVTASSSAAPSDAIVLFDGKDLSQWQGGKEGVPARWAVKDGVATVNRTGSISTRQNFGDCQLHLEWATPALVKGTGQGRGNSGVYLSGLYEVQVLDSYNNKTYYHGQAGALYKQYAPLVNASRKPGEWQSYDIVYHVPRFDSDGVLTKPGTVTVLQNGVLVQDNVEIKGPTAPAGAPKYKAHPLKQPIGLQDHSTPVRYRNIWIREL